MITTLGQMADTVRLSGVKRRIAVACAQDPNTVGSLYRAVSEGFVDAIMIGQPDRILSTCQNTGADPGRFTILEAADEKSAAELAVSLTRSGEADIVMKGLVGTDKFLRAVLDKEKGLLPHGAVMSYVCAVEIPAYHKLLFITDTAVLPFPDIEQKVAMARYAIEMARRFGIDKPRVALVGASEKVSDRFPNTLDYNEMCRMAESGEIENCIMDGPLDLFLACDPESVKIKGVNTPVAGDADILLFPSLEACNPFYKALMLFAGGELAGMICGTSKPVVLMSRSESELSKYYCVALSCLMAPQNG
ncbi:MAG: phosphate acetyltransferase [Bacteroidales bacterium]|nr:phosphate acyltransferase [Bacteroidales bacterium]NLD64412.1 phosphate acetyltransferase [Bacteroidales bacterium]